MGHSTAYMRKRRAWRRSMNLCAECGERLVGASLERFPGPGKPPKGYACAKCRKAKAAQAAKRRKRDLLDVVGQPSEDSENPG